MPQVLHPCDDVVGLVCFDPDSGAPELIDPDSKLMDDIFPAAAALFEEDDIELMRTASVLTMQGSHHFARAESALLERTDAH
jgi:hypothetical protein